MFVGYIGLNFLWSLVVSCLLFGLIGYILMKLFGQKFIVDDTDRAKYELNDTGLVYKIFNLLCLFFFGS